MGIEVGLNWLDVLMCHNHPQPNDHCTKLPESTIGQITYDEQWAKQSMD